MSYNISGNVTDNDYAYYIRDSRGDIIALLAVFRVPSETDGAVASFVFIDCYASRLLVAEYAKRFTLQLHCGMRIYSAYGVESLVRNLRSL